MNSALLTAFEQQQQEFRRIVKETLREVLTENNFTQASKAEPQKQFLSRHEAAAMLGISLVTLDNYVKSGFISAFRLGHRVRFKYDDVLKALTKINVGG